MGRRRSTRSADRPVAQLPQRASVWQVDVRRLAAPVDVNGITLIRPWLIVIGSISENYVFSIAMVDAAPSVEEIRDALVGTMHKPGRGKPHRPTEIQIRPLKRSQALAPLLDGAGIQFTSQQKLPLIDRVFDALLDDLAGDDQPALLDRPNVTPRQVQALFVAAAHAYRNLAWTKLDQRTLKVECPECGRGPWYARLTGEEGTPPGLVLYDERQGLGDLQRTGRAAKAKARPSAALAVFFGSHEDLPVSEQQAVQQYRWPVAGKQAYPAFFRKVPDGGLRSPEAWEQTLLEAVLLALPAFVGQRRRKIPAPPPAPLPVLLSWLD